MKTKNIVIIGGLLALGYYWYKNQKAKKPINIDPPIEKKEPQTIVINMNNTRQRPSGLFPESMYSQYNASKMATVAPPMVTIF